MTNNDQINFSVDQDAKELAKGKLEHGELSEALRETVRSIAFGEEVGKHEKIKARLLSLRDTKDELRSEKRELEANIEDVEQKIARVEERLDKLDRKEDKYEASLEMLEDQLMTGTHIFPDHGQVVKAAMLGEKEPEDVINDLQERNPSVPHYAFESKMDTRENWSGIRSGPSIAGED
jgi:chromosome segregation ATPase